MKTKAKAKAKTPPPPAPAAPNPELATTNSPLGTRNSELGTQNSELATVTFPRSYAPQVIADDSGQWTGNGLRFATEAEAQANVSALASRWFLVRETRVVPTDDPVNYRWVDGDLQEVPATPAEHTLTAPLATEPAAEPLVAPLPEPLGTRNSEPGTRNPELETPTFNWRNRYANAH